MSAAVGARYKQTEVGVVPEDWRCQPLNELTDPMRPIGYGIVQTGKTVRNGVKCVRVVDMIDGHIDPELLITTSEEISSAYKRTLLREDDVVIALRGKIGAVAVIQSNLAGSNLTRGVALLSSSGNFDSIYLSQYLSSATGKSVIERNLNGSALQEIPIAALRKLPAVVPPLPEQRAIATALSDVDALLAKLDALVAKKRDLKVAAMQQLLTGQTRLPGFSGDWEVRRLGELFAFSGGHTASRDQLSDTGYCYLHYGDIHLSKKTFIDVEAEFLEIPKLVVSLSDVSTASILKDGDVVFVDASEDDEGTSKHIVVVNKDDRPYISGLHTIVAKSKANRIDNLFKRYCFQTRNIKEQFRFFAVGTKVSGISKTSVAKVDLHFPTSMDEQAAIATVLSDMDAELAALEARRDKTRALKQGMMQELLTGRIRLIDTQVTTAKQPEQKSAEAEQPHSWAFNEAVVIAVLADQFGKPEFPLGRMRYTKLAYLMHRKAENDAQGYLKKKAGPYNPQTRYAGPEKIAQQNGYVRAHSNGKFKGWVGADKIEQAKNYFDRWYGPELAGWLEQFRYTSNDGLERLATVDMAMKELAQQGKPVDLNAVRTLIESEPEWAPKLTREVFSDDGIAAAMAECRRLFGDEGSMIDF